MNLLNNPAFVAYALTCVALSCNLLFLWAYSGAARNKVKSTPNPEDAARFGATLGDIDPPGIARVLRAHANAQASIVPFLALGLVYVLAGGPLGPAVLYFAVFTVARWLHSWAYLGARQPLRTIVFVVASLSLLALTVHVVWLLIAAR
jgi:prostaglandin-E synthase 1